MSHHLNAAEIAEIFPAVGEIGDVELRSKVVAIWTEIASEMLWEDLLKVPRSIKALPDRSLVSHIHGVTQTAIAICEIARSLHGVRYDRDLLVGACLLHDASRPIEYEPDPDSPHQPGQLPRGRMSATGKALQHAVYAAHKCMEKKLPLALTNLVITHTHASNVRATSWEGAALFYADYADTDADLSIAGKQMFSTQWELSSPTG
jgi:putative nucleotidyltransferase with HDIG domain